MNVSLMFVFNANFYFETRLLKPNGKNARKRQEYCSIYQWTRFQIIKIRGPPFDFVAGYG